MSISHLANQGQSIDQLIDITEPAKHKFSALLSEADDNILGIRVYVTRRRVQWYAIRHDFCRSAIQI